LDFTDLKGGNFEKAKKYISDYSDFEFPRNSVYWRALMDFKRIRNLILHQGGEISKTDKHIIRIIQKYSGLKENELEYKIALSMDFINRVAITINSFFAEFGELNQDILKSQKTT
jgi:hypothetical protein